MPAGHNGPWFDRDTPVRTTAHWAVQFAVAARITGDARLQAAAGEACAYLLGSEARPEGHAFLCRRSRLKDDSNNLVGQAWALEALLTVGTLMKDARCLDTALQVALEHRFDDSLELWRRLEVDGRQGPAPTTLNQQIFFSSVALALGRLLNRPELVAPAERFFTTFLDKVVQLSPGLPHHKLAPLSHPAPRLRDLLSPVLWREVVDRFWWRRQAVGYAPFILYGLAWAHRASPQERFWSSSALQGWIRDLLARLIAAFPYGYMESSDSYRWAYNPVGLEVAFALAQFGELLPTEESPQRWIAKQLEGYYDLDSGLLSLNTGDGVILAARLYEAVWLLDF